MQRQTVRSLLSLIRVILTNSSRISLLQAKLPPGANRILFVKNLNYQITGEDLYDLFGRYGSIRQIRIGNEPKTKGTAFVVFDDVMDVRSVLSTFFLPSPPM
jgi:RNA recognition motif-containing protein